MGQIKHTHLHEKFIELEKASEKAGEAKDCTVKAVALVAGVSYEMAHAALTAHGRLKKTGTKIPVTKAALKMLGFRVVSYDKRKIIRKFPKHHSNLKFITSHSPRRFPKAFEDTPKVMLAFTTDHAFAIIDHTNIDWSVNRKLRIQTLYEVLPDWENILESEDE
jgi:hypothetical protein